MNPSLRVQRPEAVLHPACGDSACPGDVTAPGASAGAGDADGVSHRDQVVIADSIVWYEPTNVFLESPLVRSERVDAWIARVSGWLAGARLRWRKAHAGRDRQGGR